MTITHTTRPARTVTRVVADTEDDFQCDLIRLPSGTLRAGLRYDVTIRGLDANEPTIGGRPVSWRDVVIRIKAPAGSGGREAERAAAADVHDWLAAEPNRTIRPTPNVDAWVAREDGDVVAVALTIEDLVADLDEDEDDPTEGDGDEDEDDPTEGDGDLDEDDPTDLPPRCSWRGNAIDGPYMSWRVVFYDSLADKKGVEAYAVRDGADPIVPTFVVDAFRARGLL